MSETRATWNEDDLRADIVRVWGEHGAHADLHDWMVRHIREQEAEIQALRAVLLDTLHEHANDADNPCTSCQSSLDEWPAAATEHKRVPVTNEQETT